MTVLLYGTAIYNAPNDGSLQLEGQWWGFGMNFTSEYDAIRREQYEAEMDAKWEAKRAEFKQRTYSSFKRYVGAQHN